jgi:hypothetical protein
MAADGSVSLLTLNVVWVPFSFAAAGKTQEEALQL